MYQSVAPAVLLVKNQVLLYLQYEYYSSRTSIQAGSDVMSTPATLLLINTCTTRTSTSTSTSNGTVRVQYSMNRHSWLGALRMVPVLVGSSQYMHVQYWYQQYSSTERSTATATRSSRGTYLLVQFFGYSSTTCSTSTSTMYSTSTSTSTGCTTTRYSRNCFWLEFEIQLQYSL